ncbi:hypothetical protein LguiA_009150 [Lonicera macranthoides]
MITPKKLIKMARKWQKMAANRHVRIALPRSKDNGDSSRVDKGHFVVYTADERRFVIPLVYLKSEIFGGLLKLSEEEYGLRFDGPITLPCDEAFLKYTISLIQRHSDENMANDWLMSLSSTRCSSSSFVQVEQFSQQLIVNSF